jgi:hypothetical protein
MAKDLPTFIRNLGVEKAAELFDESPRAVKGWLYRERVPRPAKAKKLVEKSRGGLTLASIYRESVQ